MLTSGQVIFLLQKRTSVQKIHENAFRWDEQLAL